MPLTPERRLEIEQWATRFGCANCWTGNLGTAATYIRELMDETLLPPGMEVSTSGASVPVKGDAKYLALLDEMRALHIRKSADYGTDEDALANIRGSVAIGIDPWRAAYLRLLDKINRINRYCVKGTLANESVRDSFLDAAAYALLALRLFDEGQANEPSTNNVVSPLVADVPAPANQTFQAWMNDARQVGA